MMKHPENLQYSLFGAHDHKGPGFGACDDFFLFFFFFFFCITLEPEEIQLNACNCPSKKASGTSST